MSFTTARLPFVFMVTFKLLKCVLVLPKKKKDIVPNRNELKLNKRDRENTE